MSLRALAAEAASVKVSHFVGERRLVPLPSAMPLLSGALRARRVVSLSQGPWGLARMS